MSRVQPNALLFGKYRIQRLLDRGGFAEVYLAEHLHLKALRALKVLTRGGRVTTGALHKAAERFRLEAQLGARFTQESHIVRVYDFEWDPDQGLLVLVMEYMPGGSLKERIRQAREQGLPGLPVDFVVRTAYDVARGLATLHQAELVHRDIKPSNILYDAEGRAKVADLGVVQMPHGLTRRTELGDTAPRHPGTPEYMSPEQEGTTAYLPPASDIYSLGVTLFEALTLRRYRHLRPGTRVRELRPEVPTWLDDLLARMLARNPEARPWDGQELAQILALYVSEMSSSVALTPSTPSQEEQEEKVQEELPEKASEHALPSEPAPGIDSEDGLASRLPEEPLPLESPSEEAVFPTTTTDTDVSLEATEVLSSSPETMGMERENEEEQRSDASFHPPIESPAITATDDLTDLLTVGTTVQETTSSFIPPPPMPPSPTEDTSRKTESNKPYAPAPTARPLSPPQPPQKPYSPPRPSSFQTASHSPSWVSVYGPWILFFILSLFIVILAWSQRQYRASSNTTREIYQNKQQKNIKARTPPPRTPSTPMGNSCRPNAREIPNEVRALGWRVLLCDDFDDNRFLWDIGSFESELTSGERRITQGRLMWTGVSYQYGFWWWIQPKRRMRSLTDFFVSIEARIQQGNKDTCYGFRLRDQGDSFYLFELCTTGKVTLWKIYQGQSSPLKSGYIKERYTPYFHKGEWNRMGALLQGSRLRFYINNRLFDATVDPSLEEGSISLYISVPKQTEYSFSFDRFFVLVP